MQKNKGTRLKRSAQKGSFNKAANNKYSYTDHYQRKTPRPTLLTETISSTEPNSKSLSFRTGLSRKILAAMNDAFILTDNLGLIKTTNQKLQELLGYPGDELLNKPLSMIINETPGWDDIVSTTSLEISDSRETTLRTRKGENIPVDISVIPYTDKANSSFYTIILAKDLSENSRLKHDLETTKKELTENVSRLEDFRESVIYMLKNLDHSEFELQQTSMELKEAQAQLVQTTKLMALGELTAGLAHELNQPLTVIRGISQYLIRDFDENSLQVEKLKFIESATQKMEKTISHLKAFSRLDDHAMVNTDLNVVINNSLLLISEILKSKFIKVKLYLQKLPPIKGQPNRLEQVLINLITNARDAMPEGGTIEITTSCTEVRSTQFVTISIKDTGYGIPENIKRRIFEPFFTTKDVHEGTGLGLSISYGIIKDHGGNITFESATPSKTSFREGSTFNISIPVASPDDT